ncbi:MAG: GAF and ANTAR domain-containing protein [Nitriliruptoraceae bacterium]
MGRDQHDAQDALLEHLAWIAVQLSDADTLQTTLQRIVDLGEALLEGCDGVSLMLIGKGGVVDTPASSSQVAYDSDMAQYATGEGPCLGAIEHERTIVIDDLETDERWPDYRARALELGVRSMLSFQLYVTADSLGALDMYSRKPHAFDRRSRLVGQVFAAQASAAMKAALVEAGHETTIRSRDVIGQAKGIVMVRTRVTADLAFELLKTRSQERNQKLVELAEEIVRTGQIPE